MVSSYSYSEKGWLRLDFAGEEECHLIFNAQSTTVIQGETRVIQLQVNVEATVHDNATLCLKRTMFKEE